MKNISVEELNEILEKHEIWLRGEEGGERADLWDTDLRGFDLIDINLSGADLRNSDLGDANLMYADLKYADLKYTNLSYTNLSDADLRGADLRGANLMGANLSNTNLSNTNLSDTDLSDADLMGANLSDTNLSDADLRGADLRGANLSDTDLSDADLMGANLSDTDISDADLRGTNLWDTDLSNTNLKNVKTNINTIGYNLACPEEGSFIGYKRASGCMVKLLILDDAKRSSATTYKCRCDKAKVLDIENAYTGEKIEETKSDYDPKFIYRVGEIVTVEDFDDNRWNECSTGIHFFVNKENALNY